MLKTYKVITDLSIQRKWTLNQDRSVVEGSAEPWDTMQITVIEQVKENEDDKIVERRRWFADLKLTASGWEWEIFDPIPENKEKGHDLDRNIAVDKVVEILITNLESLK